MWRKCKIILNEIDCRMSPRNLVYMKQFYLFYSGDENLPQASDWQVLCLQYFSFQFFYIYVIHNSSMFYIMMNHL